MTTDTDIWTGETVEWDPERIRREMSEAITIDELRSLHRDYARPNLATGTMCHLRPTSQGAALGVSVVIITDTAGRRIGTAHARPLGMIRHDDDTPDEPVGGWLIIDTNGDPMTQVITDDLAEAIRFARLSDSRRRLQDY